MNLIAKGRSSSHSMRVKVRQQEKLGCTNIQVLDMWQETMIRASEKQSKLAYIFIWTLPRNKMPMTTMG